MSEDGKRRYTRVKELGPVIEEMFVQGKTKREIAEELGLPSKETVKDYLKRRRRTQERLTQGQRGRPRERPITEMEQLQKENKRLQMEVELLRSFLQEIERG